MALPLDPGRNLQASGTSFRSGGSSLESLSNRLINLLQCQPGDPLLSKDLEAVKALLELGVPPGFQDVEQSKTWRLPGMEQINTAFHTYFGQATAGGQSDPVCKWMFDWSTSSTAAPAMHRFAARYAPLLAAKYLLLDWQSSASSQGLGLEACLIGIYNTELMRAVPFALPPTEAPSPYHLAESVPAVVAAALREARQGHESRDRGAPGGLAPGIAAILRDRHTEAPRTRMVAGIPAWERERVAAASFLLFCRWMPTFPESVISEVAELAADLLASGCPWAVERAQDHLKGAEGINLSGSAWPSAECLQRSVRLPLSRPLAAPLSRILAHAAYRAALARGSWEVLARAAPQPAPNVDVAGDAVKTSSVEDGGHGGVSSSGMGADADGARVVGRGLGEVPRRLLENALGGAGLLHVRAQQNLDPSTLILSQATLQTILLLEKG